MLHVATDWPGHFPDIARTIAVLVAAGADIEADGAEIDWPAPRDGSRPIDAATESDSPNLVDWLAEQGAKPPTGRR